MMINECDFCGDETEEVYTPDDGITFLCNDCAESNEHELEEDVMMNLCRGIKPNARTNEDLQKGVKNTSDV